MRQPLFSIDHLSIFLSSKLILYILNFDWQKAILVKPIFLNYYLDNINLERNLIR